jgi:hypothetical protein
MDNMIRDEKNITDKTFSLNLSLKDKTLPSLSYTKTHKLITALYMVTDIMDKEEPLRNKLRTLGIEILSDVSNMSKAVFDIQKIDQAMSFLDIAGAMNFISEMNCSILKKEFLELKVSIQDSIQVKPVWLEEFLKDSKEEKIPLPNLPLRRGRSEEGVLFFGESISKGHTRIGVQKGSTLMKAIKDMSYRNNLEARPNTLGLASRIQDLNFLKKQRRDNIINIIKIIGGNATITDIKTKIASLPAMAGSLVSCSEKTLQRELISMVKDNVLYKTGEKRWSRYFVRN